MQVCSLDISYNFKTDNDLLIGNRIACGLGRWWVGGWKLSEGIGLWTLLYIRHSCSALECDLVVLLSFRLCYLRISRRGLFAFRILNICVVK